MTLLVPGHRTDPVQAASYQCLLMLRRQLKRRPEYLEILRRSWDAGGGRVPGPVDWIRATLADLGRGWESPEQFTRPGKPALNIVAGDDKWWQHEIRDGLRLAQWRQAGQRRADMRGLDSSHGVDRLATLALC